MTEDNQSKKHAKDWIAVGGILGAVILVSRLTRTPLASILGVLPFLLPLFRQTEQQQAHARSTSANHSTMTHEEAALILGVAPQAAAEDVREAHRRLIQKNHPDQGGSGYLAAKINQARDVLLGKK